MIEFDELQKQLIELKRAKTLRQISNEIYDGEVSYGVIHRCINGIEPKDNEIRKRLGLPIITYQYRDPITGRFVEKA